MFYINYQRGFHLRPCEAAGNGFSSFDDFYDFSGFDDFNVSVDFRHRVATTAFHFTTDKSRLEIFFRFEETMAAAKQLEADSEENISWREK